MEPIFMYVGKETLEPEQKSETDFVLIYRLLIN